MRVKPAKWRGMRSASLPPVPKLQKRFRTSDRIVTLVARVVVVAIAAVSFVATTVLLDRTTQQEVIQAKN